MTGAFEVRTTCPYCGTGCGVLARPDGAGGLAVRGDPDHPANFGRLCSKGYALGETVGLEARLPTPRIGGRAATWDAALDLVAATFSAAIAEHGPDSVAFYLSGQLLTEDYYVANKLMKGFIGSANVDTNSRLCMASSVAGHRRAFGTDTVPGTYEDLDQADLVVLVGSNLAWCHPVLYQRIVAAREARPAMRVVVIDPRRTATCDIADLHLAIAPGSDVALFNGLLTAIETAGAIDEAYTTAHTSGLAGALAAARAADLAETGLSPADLATFFRLWIGTEKVVTAFSQGVNQSCSGTDKVNAIINCHLATGRIGRVGMGPFSLTGQPNAMGGREVGGMANTLACHLDIEDAAHRAAVQAFWKAPKMPDRPGLKAVEMFRAVADGRIKALWIVSTNPAASMPEADAVRAAIAACPFTVVSDLTAETDTARLADVLLPATGWAEKAGTVTNSDRTISRQRRVLPAPGEARDDWRIFCDVAIRMGFAKAFDFDAPAEIFREHAALSGVAVALGRDFDICALADLTEAGYAALPPTRWPVSATRQGGRFFAEGGFFTADRRARLVPVTPRPAQPLTAAHPFRLNTGRVRDHWHTMTRTGKSARLSQHIAEPFVEMHPGDAARLGIAPATLARVTSPTGTAILRVLVTDRVQPGQVFAPIHWTGETAPTGRVDALIASTTDPLSGQPDSKAAAVAVAPFPARWFAFAVSQGTLSPDSAYWARARTVTGFRAELAGSEPVPDWDAEARRLFALPAAEAITVTDPGRGIARIALLCEGRIAAAIFVAPDPVALSRRHAIGLIGGGEMQGLLAGWPGDQRPDPGAIVCSCFDIGVNTVLAAIETRGLLSVEAIGAALRAGTNCGSCRPELRALLASRQIRQAAE
ncbi:MAG: molybdopterin-dependent oxidoreductase [Rhodobacteraceae bacterium]|nr:molybdopterin-dependent oxidoreductase [Paracoccaceae bacterium]